MPVMKGTCGVVNDLSMINDQLNAQRDSSQPQFELNPRLPELPQKEVPVPFNKNQPVLENLQMYPPGGVPSDIPEVEPQYSYEDNSKFNPDISLGIPAVGQFGSVFPKHYDERNYLTENPTINDQ